MGPWMMGYYGLGWITPVIWIVITGLILWGMMAIVRNTGSSGKKHEESALEVLKMRYARDEMNKAEYEQKKKDLV